MGLLLDKAVAVLKAGGTKYPPLVLRKEYKPSVTAAGPSHEMTGPLGTMGTGYTGTEETYVYTATARAGTGSVAVRTVRITDTLDSNLDRSTVALRELRIGDLRVPLVGTTFPYHGYLDLRPGVKSIAEITIGYDPGTGMLTWDVMGHDPLSWNATTLLLPADAANGAKHELAVCFSVRPKAALGSGLTIANKAMVTLDGGVSAQTNERLNTIDAGPPSSEVSALPVVQEDADFTVRWTGRDEALGSGMACYSVYVRDNDGPYTLWKSRVTSTSAVYTGQMGHTYGFYTIAEDMVGHVEAPPTQADAAIKIGRDVALARGLRMVCVPLIPEQTDPKQLLGFAEGRWARYLPGTGYVKYSADPERLTWLDPPAQVPGRGYWGYWLEDKVIDPAGTPLPPVDSYALPLVDGWNLLGNPWTKTVGWDAAAVKVSLDGVTKTLAEATEAGWVDDIAWRWTPSAANPETGKYEMIADASITGAVHELAPWRGFWLRAYRPCALILPSPVAPAPVTAARRSTRIRQDGWQVQLTVRSGDAEDVCNWFGVATRPWNALSPPPPPGNWVDLAFAGGRVADLKPSDNVPWRFTVTAPTPGAEVSLAWPDLTALPPGTSLTLVDETTGVRRDLRTATGYTFTAPADGLAAPFHIEVAARAPLAMLGVTATPTRTPGSLAVTCRLSRGATVTAEVRTLTGVILRRLDGGRGETSTLLWDGRDTAGRAVRGTVLVLVTATDEQGQTVRGMTIGAGR
jgi:hypothetical protein